MKRKEAMSIVVDVLVNICRPFLQCKWREIGSQPQLALRSLDNRLFLCRCLFEHGSIIT